MIVFRVCLILFSFFYSLVLFELWSVELLTLQYLTVLLGFLCVLAMVVESRTILYLGFEELDQGEKECQPESSET